MMRRRQIIAMVGALTIMGGGGYSLRGAEAAAPAARQVAATTTYQLTIMTSTPPHVGKVGGNISASYGPSGATIRLTCRIPSTGQRCTYQVPARAHVRFRVHGTSNVSFDHWAIKRVAGSRTSKRSTVGVTMNGDVTVEAVFKAASTYRLTVLQAVIPPKPSSSGKGNRQPPLREAGGTVSVAYTAGGKNVSHRCRLVHCVYQVPLGARIGATESAGAGFHWKSWQIKGSGVPLRTSSQSTVHVTVNRAYIVTALYSHP